MPDTVRDIVDVAVSVIDDYADDANETRISRMAHWILLNLGVEVNDRKLGSVSKISTDITNVSVLQIGVRVVMHSAEPMRLLGCEQARQLATALLMGVERSEMYPPLGS